MTQLLSYPKSRKFREAQKFHVDLPNKEARTHAYFKGGGTNKSRTAVLAAFYGRISAVICTLEEQGLPYRGDNEQFGSSKNGNYLGLLELVAKFDPILLARINLYGNSESFLLIYEKLYAKK